MGTLYYGGSATPIEIDDRALAHLKVVIATKLRRGESFTVTWQHPEDQARGRSTIWLQPSIPMRFVFDDPEPIALNRGWVEELANSANSSGGVTLIAEHFDPPPGEVLEADPDSSGRKVEVGELSIAHLTVAGTEMSIGSAASETQTARAAESSELLREVD